MATEVQSVVSSALQKLGFEFEDGMPGAPQALKITDETIKFLEGLKEEDKEVVVDSYGKVKVH